MTAEGLSARQRDILRRNHLEYDDADDLYWRKTVYEPVHEGWSFASIGGRHVLEVLSDAARLGPHSRVFELCCGLAETCVYLAERHGCRVTGVEMNRHQVARARRRLVERNARDVEVVHADVARWEPGARYTAGVCIDSLMLLDDPARAMKTAARALEPGGLLVVADVLAGIRVTSAIRRFAWSEDGIVSLLSPTEHDRVLEAAGFTRVARFDRTDLAVTCFERMIAASHAHRAALIAAKGRQRYARWVGNASRYLQLFRSGALQYSIVTSAA